MFIYSRNSPVGFLEHSRQVLPPSGFVLCCVRPPQQSEGCKGCSYSHMIHTLKIQAYTAWSTITTQTTYKLHLTPQKGKGTWNPTDKKPAV